MLAVASPAVSAQTQDFDAMVAEVKADMLARPTHAVKLADRLQQRADGEPDRKRRPLMRATALWLRGEAQVRVGNAAQASIILAQARRTTIITAPDSLLLADILLAQGSALTDTGNVAEALPTLQRAHDLFLRLKQARGRAKALILLALLYEGGRDHAAALKYFAQAEDAYRGDPGLLLSIYGGRGVSLDNQRRYADAENAFRKALKIARDLNSETSVAPLLGNIGRMQLRRGDVAAALSTIRQGLRLADRPTARAFRPQLLMLQADAMFKMGNLAHAAALMDERFRGVDIEKTILNDRDAHETAYRIYTAVGKDRLALRHLAALKRLDDQATEIARSTGAALMAARFDYANQELRIAKLKADDLTKTVAFERAAAGTQRMIFVGVTLITALVIAMLAFGLVTLRRSRNSVRAANADLNTTNAKLEKALAAKTEFLATTSHEIRTPLNGILGMTQVMIADPALDATTRDRLSVVEGAGATMRALIDDILDVAKIETGKMTIESVPLDVAAVVRDAARMWRDQARARGLGFDIDVTDAPLWIMGDAARLRQITFNLLSNAVKFTPAGGVSVALAVRDGQLMLMVADTGIGIDPAAQDVIFESFRQADAGTTRQFGGTGLGLSICRNLARRMHGDVTVESRLGAGALFTLAIPFVPAEAPEAGSVRPALLVVEKNPITRATLKAILSDFAPIVFAADAAEAQALVATQLPERILADLLSLSEDVGAVATLARCAPLALMVPAGAGQAWLNTGARLVLERPIGRKSLANAVSDLTSTLVRVAA
jgi:signal transduction histidine kinase/CheY-like chemotaxis protein